MSPFRVAVQQRTRRFEAFTLIEILIVLAIISVLMAGMGVTIASYLRSAREAQTISTIKRIDGLISERIKGLERAYRRPDFQNFVNRLQVQLDQGDAAAGLPQLPGFSREATEMLARKIFTRTLFPQYFNEPVPFSTPPTTILSRIQADTSITYISANHSYSTESSALLYYALTKMEIFGIPPSADEFTSSEVQDTDGDGLLEFVDGWGQPLRFYRSPTRLIKPYGAYGPDGVPGFVGNDDAATDFGAGPESLTEVGFVGNSGSTNPGPSDDLIISNIQNPADDRRIFAGMLIKGLPRPPLRVNQPLLVAYDPLGQDPDDPYGLLLSEFRRLSATGIAVTSGDLLGAEFAGPPYTSPIWNFATFDCYHKPLVVSAGADGRLGLLEPFPTNDFNGNGTLDANENINETNLIDHYGHLACPKLMAGKKPPPPPAIIHSPTVPSNPIPTAPFIDPQAFEDVTDNITNRNREAGGTGK